MKKKKRHLQIEKLNKWDYFLLIGIFVVTFVVIDMRQIYMSNVKKNQVDLVQEIMQQTAENEKNQFEKFLEDKVDILQTFVTYPEIYEMNTQKQKDFLHGRAQKLGFNHMFVVDTAGWGYYFDEDVIRDQHEDEFYHDIMQQDVFITEPFYTNTEVVIMTACVSIYDDMGNKKGVLCGAINLNSIQQMIEKNEMILDGKSYILNENGMYVTSQNPEDVYMQKSIYDNENTDMTLVKEAFVQKKDMSGTILLNGVCYQSEVIYLDNFDWVVLQIIPESNIMERFQLFDYIQVVLTTAIFILLGCLIRIIFLWRRSDKKIYTDSLTECNSRVACVDLLDYLEKKHKEQVTIVYMDLNCFKLVNDTYGHDQGDYLLILFSDILKRTFGRYGFVGRMGGDEFIAVLLDTTEMEIKKIWEEVEKYLLSYSEKIEFPYQMSSSYGYATRKKGENTPLQEILQLADKKMYEYKVEQKKN